MSPPIRKKRSKIVAFRLTEAEYQTLAWVARREQRAVADWLRLTVTGAVQTYMKQLPGSTAAPSES